MSVFLSDATVGTRTSADGSFTLRNVKPGKYDLVVTDVAFETYSQPVGIQNRDIRLPDILISTQTHLLRGVTIRYRSDPNREKYLNWFKDAFLGNSERAKYCKILNPDVLDFSFEATDSTLKASTYDFLIIENDALGYRIKYLLKDFVMRDSLFKKAIRYRGFALFEELKGTPSQKDAWYRARREIYTNSPMHFFRSLLSDRLDADGFRVQKLAVYANPERPPDSLIDARIRFYKNKSGPERRDSMSYWLKKSKLPKTFQKLLPDPLHRKDIIRPTNQPNQYLLSCNNGGLIVAYNKKRHFHINDRVEYLYNTSNTDNTLIMFNSPDAIVYTIGVLSDPYSVTYRGVWGRYRAAELLPIDYEPPEGTDIPTGFGPGEISAKLDSFLTGHPGERAYLQFDKPYYAAGDTMYFKAYVVMGERHVLSRISGVLHADLVGTDNKIIQSIILRLDTGLAHGDFALPDS
ncbi:MAG TPA: carboxypeptidase-like regulatory domain-containing protein, partial [Mucilaginibacter sp.]|nr:carboxypeptidase-like regulatory domain-containing protein [Mucilaginibacter sp.]